jgi:hypothetical protein
LSKALPRYAKPDFFPPDLSKGQEMTGITAYGAYIPQRRLQRKVISQANAWFAPGQRGSGERAMANWDEDAITLAVEAARDCLLRLTPSRIGPISKRPISHPRPCRSRIARTP